MTTILAPYTSIADIDGSPLDAGFIYIGEQGKNPEASPVPVFWDADFTIPAAQPIRTRNGYLVRNGSPAKIYLREPMHSISVKNKNGSVIFVDVNGAGLVSTLLVRPSGITVEQTFKDIDQEINTKADQNFVEEQLELKANAADVYQKDEVFTKTEASALIDPKADQIYVDEAIGAISTDANKQYATLAEANADIANIVVGRNVFISEAINGGYWYKATSEATSLTKSPYDPVEIGKKTFINVFDTHSLLISSNLNRYVYAVVVNDPDLSKNGYYQKNVNYEWQRVRLNSEVDTREYLSKKGFAQIMPLADSNINYVTSTGTLTITGTVFAVTNNQQYALDTPIDLVMSSSGLYRLEFNESTRKLRVVQAATSKTDTWLPVGFIRRNWDGIVTNLFNFYVNGAALGFDAKTNYSLMLAKPNALDFAFKDNKIVVTGNLWIMYKGSRIQITPQEITLDPSRNKGYIYLLIVNPDNSTLYIKSQQAPFTVPNNHFQIGAYHEADMLFFGIEHFYVNGKPHAKQAGVPPSFGFATDNKVEVNVADSMTVNDPLYMGTLTSSLVYSWFDALADDYPDYITKTLLGNDESGSLPIYQYRFKPKLPNPHEYVLNTKIPKVMLITVHNEGMNMVALHILMREICRNWQNSDALTSMRFGIEFVVIPVGNPWGLDNGKRTNVNKIDINRQFPANWIQDGVVGDYFYSGTSALSEAEAQHIYASMVNENPDVYFDVHSYGAWNKNGTSAWIPLLNDKTNSAVISAMTKIYAQYKKQYSWLVDIEDLMDVSNENILGGGTSSKSAASLGAVGGTFETAWNLKDAPDGGLRGHTPAINFTVDLLGTCILQAIKIASR